MRGRLLNWQAAEARILRGQTRSGGTVKNRLALALVLGAALSAVSLAPLAIRSAHAQTPANPAATVSTVDPSATPVAAPTIPTSLDGDAALIPTVISDFAAGGPKTLLGAGVLLMILVSVFNLAIFPRIGIPPTVTPWLSLALGVLGGIATALASGKPLVGALIYGAMVGFAATGKWETFAKHVAPDAASPKFGA
jgi:hypothetical protein